MAQRGRPKSEGELKESSVRVRAGLKTKLEEAAAESGVSIARELEERLEATFTEVPMRGPTRDLVRQIALAAKDVEAATGKAWDKDLTTWAMLREALANGPLVKAIPHPDPDATARIIAANAELAELKAERNGIARTLRGFGVEPTGDPLLGAAWLGVPETVNVREAIEERNDLPADMRTALLEQADRLTELEAEIATLQDQVSRGMLPYLKARKEARQRLYGTRGIPDLPTWLTSPVAMDEPPPTRRGMFAPR
jgi:hypothetical protein